MIKQKLSTFLLYFFVILLALVSLFPFYWLSVMATRTSAEFFRYPPILIPGPMLIKNAKALFTAINFPLALGNTFLVSFIKMAFALFFCSMAAFYFAKFKFPGRRPLFSMVLLTMMIPTQLCMVPLLVIVGKLGWISTLKALIVPTLVPAFGVFWMHQYCQGAIHDDLLNAGRIDGCGTFRLFFNVGLPIIVPGLAFLAIYTFMETWNDFLWPLIVLNDQRKYTIQVALGQLQGMHTKTDYGAVMCGTLLATLPIIVIFLACNKYFIAGITAGGIKD